jgi:hypothetical protein
MQQGTKEFDQLVRDSFELDEDTGKLYWKMVSKYHNEKLGKEAGCIVLSKGQSRCVIHLRGKHIKRARIVYFLVNGKWPNPLVDHINRDTLDDRPENLREADYELNNHNHSRKNISQFKSGLYRVRLGNKYIGSSRDLTEAESLYDNARSQQWQT